MTATINVDGRISDERHAVIAVLDHGFLFGEGVYETIRTYNRKPFLFDRHLRRLRASAEMINLHVPLSDEQFLSRVSETMSEAGGVREAYIRIILTRGVGDLSYDPRTCPTPSVVIIVKPLDEFPPEILERGVKVTLSTIIRNHPGAINPRIKSNNLLNNALAMQEAFTQGATEALMRNYRGELAECSQANFFIVRTGEAFTPPLGAGLLEGVTRNFMFEVGAACGVPIRELVLWEDDLTTADEAFMTGTTREVVPIVQVGELVIGKGSPGPVTKKLMEGLTSRAHDLTGASATRAW